MTKNTFSKIMLRLIRRLGLDDTFNYFTSELNEENYIFFQKLLSKYQIKSLKNKVSCLCRVVHINAVWYSHF